MNRLENGFLFAAAGIVSWRDKNQRLQKRFQPISIEPDWWDDATGVRRFSDTLWTLGDCSFRLYNDDDGQFINVAFTAVKFEASSLYGVLPTPKKPFIPDQSDEPPPTGYDVQDLKRLAGLDNGQRIARSATEIFPQLTASPASSSAELNPSPPYRAKKRVHTKKADRVKSDDLKAWFAKYVEDNRGLVERQFVEAANNHFAPLRVGRDPIRDLIRDFDVVKNRGKPTAKGK